MGLFDWLFGRRRQQDEVRRLWELTLRVVRDDATQLAMAPAEIRERYAAGPDWDRDPAGVGPFGHDPRNPIPVCGPIGALGYLSSLETEAGERILFQRIGAVGLIDAFEAVTFTGSAWFILWVDVYHPRKSRALPDGFRFTEQLPQFSGFCTRVPDFPRSFLEAKHRYAPQLAMFYIPGSLVGDAIRGDAFHRPPEHLAALEAVAAGLTSSLTADGTLTVTPQAMPGDRTRH